MSTLTPLERDAIRAVVTSVVGSRPRHNRSATRRMAFGGVLLAVSAVAALVVVTVVAPPGGVGVSDARAAELLTGAAAAVNTDRDVGLGEYERIETRAEYLALSSEDGSAERMIGYLSPQVTTLYIPRTVSAATVSTTTYLEPTVYYGDGARELAAADATSRGTLGIELIDDTPVNGELGGAPAPVDDPNSLPRDAQSLLAALRVGAVEGISADQSAFDRVIALLRSGTTDAEQRRSLYSALALIPTIIVVDDEAVLDGREGTAFSMSTFEGENRQDLIVDTSTGDYIGERLVTVLGFGAIPAGTAMQSTSVTTTMVGASQLPQHTAD